ncbi:hypothetical protein MLD38_001300 [Melastoma candidum]|uniref:Uncharacterized protein n=1 Tax=Melastoma candidum TaxID=119954 RepID=A0ACB9SCX6_9MYRT|nr:hypothetical protein MLD38_001300 [Melastoma candidum]
MDCGGGGGEEKREATADVKEGVASIAILPCGSISGHFIQLPHSVCYGLHGTVLACERECSRGEDYRLIKLSILDFQTKQEQDVIVECKGHDAARFQNVDHAHGWEENVTGLVEQAQGKTNILVSFECETLKSDHEAEEHIRRYMPKLSGLDAVVNVGPMRIEHLDFDSEDDHH